jgi:hypothetical protein
MWAVPVAEKPCKKPRTEVYQVPPLTLLCRSRTCQATRSSGTSSTEPHSEPHQLRSFSENNPGFLSPKSGTTQALTLRLVAACIVPGQACSLADNNVSPEEVSSKAASFQKLQSCDGNSKADGHRPSVNPSCYFGGPSRPFQSSDSYSWRTSSWRRSGMVMGTEPWSRDRRPQIPTREAMTPR